MNPGDLKDAGMLEPAAVLETPRGPGGSSSAFLPLLLFGLGFVAWLAFQGWQQLADRAQLAAAEAVLAPQEESALKLRRALDALATATAALARGGNENARSVVDQLGKRGVTITPPAAAK